MSEKQKITRTEIVNLVRERLLREHQITLSLQYATWGVSALLESVVRHVNSGKQVVLGQFGLFSIKLSSPRKAHSPAERKTVDVGVRPYPIFEPSQLMKALIQGETDSAKNVIAATALLETVTDLKGSTKALERVDKTILAPEIASLAELSLETAEKLFDTFIRCLAECIVEGKEVKISGWGMFFVREKKPRRKPAKQSAAGKSFKSLPMELVFKSNQTNRRQYTPALTLMGHNTKPQIENA